jgi:WD40 repeat protein
MTPAVQDARRSARGVWSLAWSPDMRWLAVAGSQEVAFTCDPVTAGLRTLLTGHSALVNAVAWSPDGRHVATASDDRTAGSGTRSLAPG